MQALGQTINIIMLPKVLLGLRAVSLVTKCWSGRVSDKHFTEHCSILRKLLPVLADRSFDITDMVAMMHVQLHIPAFTMGKKQLSAVDTRS